MTQVIDGKVVEMKFDNSDFERNVSQSMSTLEKLKQALHFDGGQSLQEIGRAAKSFDLSGVGYAVEEVQARFSAMQVVGMTALSELTKAAIHFGVNVVSSVINPIKQGGMNRALNIEQARFQLDGLGIAWEKISEDINYSVQGTAYGLDAAAKAASQLAASGVEFGEAFGTTGSSPMAKALRGISGVAAMTNSSFEDISSIFTTVAGQGKVMTMQLRQLEARGLNAAATLGKQLGKTEDQIREMVTKGKIDFKTFSQAMDDAFGEHAKDANKTFTGAMSNVRAALSRIGANFATPFMENMRLVFVSLINIINAVNKALSPIVNDATIIMEKLQKAVTTFLGRSATEDGLVILVNTIQIAFYNLLKLIKPVKDAFRDIFPKNGLRDSSQRFRDITIAIAEFVKKITLTDEQSEKLRATFRGLFAVLDIIRMAFKGVFDAIAPYTGGIGKILDSILDFTAGIGNYLVNLRDSIKENNTFGDLFTKVADKVSAGAAKVKDALNKVIDGFVKFKQNHIDDKDFSGFTNFIDAVKNRIASLGSFGDIIKNVFGKIRDILSNLAPIFVNIFGTIGKSLGAFLSELGGAFRGKETDALSSFVSIFSSAALGHGVLTFANTMESLRQQIKNFAGLSPVLFKIKDGIRELFITVQADLQADIIMKTGKAIAVFAASLFVLSLINPVRLTSSMVAVEILMNTLKEYAMFMNTIAKGNTWGDNAAMNAMALSMITLGAAVLLLSIAVKKMASIDLIDLAKGLGATVILIKVLESTIKSLKGEEAIKGAGALIGLAIAIRILASAAKAFGKMDIKDLAKGLISVMLLIKMFSVVISDFKTKEGEVIAGAGAMIAMSIAIGILTIAIKALGKMQIDDLIVGLAGVGAAMLIMVKGLQMLATGTNAGDLAGTAASILIVAVAMNVLTKAITAIAKLKPEELAAGMFGVVVGLAAMVYALKMLSTGTTVGDLAGTAASLILLGLAINVLAAGLKVLSTIHLGVLLADLVLLFGSLFLFGAFAGALQPLLVPMLALAGVVALLGAGILALGAGVTALSVGLATLAGACTAVVANLGAILLIIATIIPAIATALAVGIIQFVVAIGKGATQIVKAVVELGKAILVGLTELMPAVFELVLTFLIELIQLIVDFTPTLVSGVIEFWAGFIEGITASLPRLIQAGIDMMLTFVNGMADGLRDNTDAMILAFDNLMDAFFSSLDKWVIHFVLKGADFVIGLAKGISELWGFLKEHGDEIANQVMEGIKSKIDGVVQLGKDFVQGFIDGIVAFPGKVWDAAAGLVTEGLAAIQKTQDSNSPAKETRNKGNDFTDGYTIGITDGNEDVQHAVEDLTQGALDKLDDGGEKANKSAEKTMDGIKDTTKTGSEETKDYIGSLVDYAKQAADDLGFYTKKTQDSARSTADLRNELKDIKNPHSEYNKNLKETAKNQEEVAKSTGKATKAAKEQKSFLETMKDTIGKQIDMFSKMELKTGVSAKQMLENMKSNIDGVASWSKRMNDLVDRGISKELYKKLAELGPKGYETMNAFWQMTGEELQQANEYFATSLTLGDNQADIVNAGYDRIGQMVVAGFADGISKDSEALNAVDTFDQKVVERGEEGLGVQSPSTVFAGIAFYCITGFRNGIIKNTNLAVDAITYLAEHVRYRAEFEFSEDQYVGYGKNIVMGVVRGLRDEQALGELRKAIDAITLEDINGGIESNEGIASPSKVTTEFGKYITLGLAVGMLSAASAVRSAAEQVTDTANSGFDGLVTSIQDYSDMNLQLMLTPLLDMSALDEQLSGLNETIGITGQNRGMSRTEPTTINNNYTQNNYSPKALSRTEIYRQTRNQLSMLKSANA